MSISRSGLDKMSGKPIQLTFRMSKSRGVNLRAGSLRVKESVREALKAALEGCGIDRETVATELSRLVGEQISVHTVNNWVADGKGDRRIPLEYAGALAVITGDKRILEAALGSAGFKVLTEDETPYFELGLVVAEEKARAKRKRKALERIGL